jgi:hypothetical protein
VVFYVLCQKPLSLRLQRAFEAAPNTPPDLEAQREEIKIDLTRMADEDSLKTYNFISTVDSDQDVVVDDVDSFRYLLGHPLLWHNFAPNPARIDSNIILPGSFKYCYLVRSLAKEQYYTGSHRYNSNGRKNRYGSILRTRLAIACIGGFWCACRNITSSCW